MGAKRKNDRGSESAGEPSAKRKTHQEPPAAESKAESKNDAHKWAYAVQAYFGKTPFKNGPELDPLLQEVRLSHAK